MSFCYFCWSIEESKHTKTMITNIFAIEHIAYVLYPIQAHSMRLSILKISVYTHLAFRISFYYVNQFHKKTMQCLILTETI